MVHMVTGENLMRDSDGVREPSKIRAHTLRMKGKTFAWRMELPSPLGLEITEFLS